MSGWVITENTEAKYTFQPVVSDKPVYWADVHNAKQITRSEGPCVVLSASGMCESGRVLHHLTATLEDPRNAVAIVGFMAQHTLGRRLAEGRSVVKIFGRELERHAEVAVLDGLSAHADRAGLLAFAEACRSRGRLAHVALVHGEPSATASLGALLTERGFEGVFAPERGDTLTIDGEGVRADARV